MPLRLDGVGDIPMFGARDYSMRTWVDPDRIASYGMTAGDVVAAIRAQDAQIEDTMRGLKADTRPASITISATIRPSSSRDQ